MLLVPSLGFTHHSFREGAAAPYRFTSLDVRRVVYRYEQSQESSSVDTEDSTPS